MGCTSSNSVQPYARNSFLTVLDLQPQEAYQYIDCYSSQELDYLIQKFFNSDKNLTSLQKQYNQNQQKESNSQRAKLKIKRKQLVLIRPFLQQLYHLKIKPQISKQLSKPLQNTKQKYVQDITNQNELNHENSLNQIEFSFLQRFLKDGKPESVSQTRTILRQYCLLTKCPADGEIFLKILFLMFSKDKLNIQSSNMGKICEMINLNLKKVQQQAPTLLTKQNYIEIMKQNMTSQVAINLRKYQQKFSIFDKEQFMNKYQLIKKLVIENQMEQYIPGKIYCIVQSSWFDKWNYYFQKTFYNKGSNNFNSIKAQDEGMSTSTGITALTKNKRNSRTSEKLFPSSSNLKPKTIEFLNIQSEYKYQLKTNIKPNKQCKILSKQLWSAIQNTYTQKPRNIFERIAINQSQIDFYATTVYLFAQKNKGQIDYESKKELFLPQITTLSQILQSLDSEAYPGKSFFTKNFEQKSFRQEVNHKITIQKVSNKKKKFFLVLAKNRVQFIQKNGRTNLNQLNYAIGDKVYAYNQYHNKYLQGYILNFQNQKKRAFVHYIGLSYRHERWCSISQLELQYDDIKNKTHPSNYEFKIKGLNNIGNTCFINSSLQCLYNSEILPKILENQKIPKKYLTQSLFKIFQGLAGKSRILEHEFKKQLNIFFPIFQGYEQHDAQQFMHLLLDKMSEEMNDIIYGLFSIQTRSQLQCKQCHQKKFNNQKMLMMSLPIPQPSHIYVHIIMIPIYKKKMQKVVLKISQSDTLAQFLKLFQERVEDSSNRFIFVETNSGKITKIRSDFSKDSPIYNKTIKQLGIVSNSKFSAYELIKQTKINAIAKENKQKDNKKNYYDYFLKAEDRWTVAKIKNYKNSSSKQAQIVYLSPNSELTTINMNKEFLQKEKLIADLNEKCYDIQYKKIFLRKFNLTYKIIQEFGLDFLIGLPLWSSYNDSVELIQQQIFNITDGNPKNGTDYIIKFVDSIKKQCIFCGKQAFMITKSETQIKKCCQVLQDDEPIHWIKKQKSFQIYIDWIGISKYDGIFSSSLIIDPECKKAQIQQKQEMVSLKECFQMLGGREEVDMECQKCKHPKMILNQLISRASPLLLIHLKQFRYTAQNTLVKINVNLPFSRIQKFSILPYMSSQSINNGQYELVGIIQHKGSGQSGHYTAKVKRYIKQQNKYFWIDFDDEFATILDDKKMEECLQNAYILLYRQTDISNSSLVQLNIF